MIETNVHQIDHNSTRFTTKQQRDRNNGNPPTTTAVGSIMALYEEFGADVFQQMVREEYCGSGGSGGSATAPSEESSSMAPTYSVKRPCMGREHGRNDSFAPRVRDLQEREERR